MIKSSANKYKESEKGTWIDSQVTKPTNINQTIIKSTVSKPSFSLDKHMSGAYKSTLRNPEPIRGVQGKSKIIKSVESGNQA